MKKVYVCFIFVILCIISACSAPVKTEDKVEFIKLSDEALTSAKEAAEKYINTYEIETYYDFKNEELYAENGQVFYDSEEFTPLGVVFELKSKDKEDFEGFVVTKFKNYENPKSAYGEYIDFLTVSPYKFLPENSYLCLGGTEYYEWYYTYYQNGGITALSEINEYMEQFNK